MKLLTGKKSLVRFWPWLFLLVVVVIFFRKFFFQNKLPIPADTIVAMYHPWLEVVWDEFNAGVPFKNFLITDPVRQQYPWRQLCLSLFKKGQLPLWNPYTQAGMPLLANLQSACLYPLNLLFFVMPFNFVWGGLIFLQPLLAGIFLYLYLRHFKLEKAACLLGALSFSFSGFFIAWLEWGTILHAALWLPLGLLAIEKIIDRFKQRKKLSLGWGFGLVISLLASLLAGHLQTTFYLVLFSLIYLAWRLFSVKKQRLRLLGLFGLLYGFFILLTSIQWLSTLQLIKLSARGVDQADFSQPGWFLPWQHLVQFLAPDFFGNPTTLNYWGIWNYGEFVAYLGVIPLILAFYAIFGRRDKRVLFFSFAAFLFLSLALSTPWAKWSYQLKIPLLSTSQPTRLLFLVDFCLAVLAAFGFNHLLSGFNRLKQNKKRLFWLLLPFSVLYAGLWFLVLFGSRFWPETIGVINLAVSKRNLVLPTAIFVSLAALLLIYNMLTNYAKKHRGAFGAVSKAGFIFAILALTVFDLWRFGWKFTPFMKQRWLFPTTETIEFLQNDKEVFRFMSTDRRLFPPNFSLAYRLQTVDGYDPLFLLRYGELIAASERGEANINPPFGFNRIITPQNYQSPIIDLLNVKYVLSLKDESSPKLKLVFQEGQTRVYQNQNYLPRAFMVYDYQVTGDKQEAIGRLMDEAVDLRKVVVLEEEPPGPDFIESDNEVKIKDYQENQVVIDVKTDKSGILVLTDAYYPGWQAMVDGQAAKIYRADYDFRAIIVPEGEHLVEFTYRPWF